MIYELGNVLSVPLSTRNETGIEDMIDRKSHSLVCSHPGFFKVGYLFGWNHTYRTNCPVLCVPSRSCWSHHVIHVKLWVVPLTLTSKADQN